MHKLQRPSPPHCLSQLFHGKNHWDDVQSADKEEIWQKLDLMQQQRCAYCEGRIGTEPSKRNAHIEHFRQRSRYPQGTFQWENLFGSCDRQDSCGKHKDQMLPYDYQVLIKMDEEDPEKFLEFLPDGSVVPVSGLTLADKNRAEETIRIFNLNGSLRQIRKTQLRGYLQTAEELVEYAEEFETSEWLPLLENELDQIKQQPFCTAIKHILLPM